MSDHIFEISEVFKQNLLTVWFHQPHRPTVHTFNVVIVVSVFAYIVKMFFVIIKFTRQIDGGFPVCF